MAVGLLSESFRDVSRNAPRRRAQLSLKLPIAGSLEAGRDGRNCLGCDQGLLINLQFLDAGRSHGDAGVKHVSVPDCRLLTADCRLRRRLLRALDVRPADAERDEAWGNVAQNRDVRKEADEERDRRGVGRGEHRTEEAVLDD